MSEAPVRGIVLGHGSMPQGLVDAVREITGLEEGALVPLSNKGLSPEDLSRRIEELVGEGPALMFVDLLPGSCGFAARRLCRDRPDRAVIFGVNLPQLLDFVMHRDMALTPLVRRLLERGHSGLCCAPDPVDEHADRSVSGG